MPINSVIADDRDLQYFGTWNQAGSSEEFRSTTTWSSTKGTSASFTFMGYGVTVYGTVSAVNPPNATLGFAVDGTTTGSFAPARGMTSDIHHLVLWTSPSLPNGTHELVITQTEAQTAGVIFLDYIMYETSSDTAGPYFVDDSDPRIVYTPSWSESSEEYDFQHTAHGSNAAGDSFSFTFEGTSISLYGDINNGTAEQVLNASMSVDKGPSVFYVRPKPAAVTSNNLIYDSGELWNGTHTLVVTAENAYPMWFDYLLVTPNPPGSPTSTFTGSAPSGSSTASSLGSNSSSSAIKKKTPVGAIVGPVVGVLVLVAIAALFFFGWRRRRQPRKSTSGSSPLASTGHSHNVGYSAALPAGAMYAAPTSVPSSGPMMHQLRPQPAQVAPLTSVRRHKGL